MAPEGEGDGASGDGAPPADDATQKTGTVLGEDTSGEGDDAEKGSAGDKPEEGKDGEPKEGDGEGESDGAADDGETPGEFDPAKFEVPEGTQLNEQWLERFTSADPIKKLTQSEAQGLIGMLGEFVGDLEAQRVEAQHAQTEAWLEEAKKDPYIVEKGGLENVLPLAITTRDAYFPDLKALLNERGLGNHPAMLVGFARIAEDLHILEGNLEGGGRPPGTTDKENAAHRLFPDYAPGGKYASASEA